MCRSGLIGTLYMILFDGLTKVVHLPNKYCHVYDLILSPLRYTLLD